MPTLTHEQLPPVKKRYIFAIESMIIAEDSYREINMRLGLASAVGLSAFVFVGLGSAARAATNLVVNGNFDAFTGGTTSEQVVSPNSGGGVTLSNWTNAGYTFLFTPGSADTSGAINTEYPTTLKLWGTNDGGTSVIPASSPLPNGGGNYIASDGGFQLGAISQSIGGLNVGSEYSLSFLWAAAQQTGFTGITTESWGVQFGNQSYQTAFVSNPSKGFTPWMQQTFDFVATSATQTLSFLATGTPLGNPPFSLLDGVSLSYVPEPSTWVVVAMAFGSLVVLGGFRRRGRPVAPGLAA